MCHVGTDWSRYPEGTGDGSRTELTARTKVRLGRQLLVWTVGKSFQYLMLEGQNRFM